MSSTDQTLFWQGVEFIDQGEPEGLLSHLRAYPHLLTMTAPEEDPPRPPYFAEPGLIHYLADNPIRHGRVSPASVDCLDVLIGMGASKDALDETLALACSSQSLADSGQDEALITALIQAGASPEAGQDAALGHRMERALHALLDSGLEPCVSIRVALDDDLSGQHIQQADRGRLQIALAVAAIWGNAKNIPALVQAGADPNAFCPEGFHAHSTPLHQAVMSGSRATVEALLAAGSDRTVRDRLWSATPLDWAKHQQDQDLAELLANEATPQNGNCQN